MTKRRQRCFNPWLCRRKCPQHRLQLPSRSFNPRTPRCDRSRYPTSKSPGRAGDSPCISRMPSFNPSAPTGRDYTPRHHHDSLTRRVTFSTESLHRAATVWTDITRMLSLFQSTRPPARGATDRSKIVPVRIVFQSTRAHTARDGPRRCAIHSDIVFQSTQTPRPPRC